MKIDLVYVRACAQAAARHYATRHAAFCSAITSRGYIALMPH